MAASANPADLLDEAQFEPTANVSMSIDLLGPKPADEGNSIFVYGTLMHPAILKRVIASDGSHLELCSAILYSYTRLHIRDETYPAIVTSDAARSVMDGKELAEEDRAVRGVLVKGLSGHEIERLDDFEDDEYRRDEVSVLPCSPLQSFESVDPNGLLSKAEALPTPSPSDLVSTYVYVWAAPIDRLAPEIWSYDKFVSDEIWKAWAATDSNRPDPEVKILPEGGEGTIVPKQKVEFGHAIKKYFNFAEGYVNLNNGSFGATPLPVLDYCREMTLLCEQCPDRWYRATYRPLLTIARERAAKVIGAETDEVVIVPNATHGIHTVLYNFDWEEGDIIVGFSTTYYAINQMITYVSQKDPKPKVSIIPLTFPSSHASILDAFRAHLKGLPNQIGQKVVVVIDSIVSNPGVSMPWEEMVKICKEENAWSLVDAAHGIGISDVTLSKSQPDFWVSNCHKWLMSQKGCAILYVPRRHHNVIRTAFPTSWGFVAPPQTTELYKIFEYAGTVDVTPWLSIIPALDFRESIGGEKAIREYCDTLAAEGARRVAELLGTEVMDSNGELLNAMVNVRLPLAVPQGTTVVDHMTWSQQFMEKLLDKHNTFIAIYVHNGSWWARLSTQIWNDMSDFEYAAKVLKDISQEMEQSFNKDIDK